MSTSKIIGFLQRNLNIIVLGIVILIVTGTIQETIAQNANAAKTDKPKAAQQGPLRFVSSNWTMICKPTGKQGALVCQASQTIVTKKGGQTLLSLSVAPWKQQFATAAYVLRVQLPHGLDLPAGVQIQIDKHKLHSLVLQTSEATGLYARTGLSADLLLLMKQGNILKVSFAAMSGKKFQIPLTLKGFKAVFGKLK